jgi:hypothetical protein
MESGSQRESFIAPFIYYRSGDISKRFRLRDQPARRIIKPLASG